MKKTIFTVLKKELARFFGDKRMVAVTLLPGVLIYCVYSLLGTFMTGVLLPDSNYKYKIMADNVPTVIAAEFSAAGIGYDALPEGGAEEGLSMVKSEDVDAVMLFPADFEDKIAAGEYPGIEVYYNSAKTESAAAYEIICAILDNYETKIANVFDINVPGQKYDLAEEKDVFASLFSTLLPLILVIMLFSGAVAVTPESIAGEKERGTIAALLVTPSDRRGIALGKITALSCIALLSGLSSALGLLLSLGNLLGSEMMPQGAIYGATDYILLALVILSTVLLMVAMMSIVSTFAKSVKEATSWSTPLMFVLMGLSFINMVDFNRSNYLLGLIPFFNSVNCMAGVFAFAVDPVNFIITILSNLVYTGLCVWGLSRMFGNEKVIFGK